MPAEFLELGAKYTGFYNQEEGPNNIEDKIEWVKENFRNEFIKKVSEGLNAEKMQSVRDAFSEVEGMIAGIDKTLIS